MLLKKLFLLLPLALMTSSCSVWFVHYNENGELIDSYGVKANSQDKLKFKKRRAFLNGELYDGILYEIIETSKKSFKKIPDKIDTESFTPNVKYNIFSSHVGTFTGISNKHPEDSIFKLRSFYKITYTKGDRTKIVSYWGEKIRVKDWYKKTSIDRK